MEPTDFSNHLKDEASLYLRQHAHHPVEWYPWRQEALDRAQEENKPIFLSIGYSSCHWCHAMAHESFENPETARLMNQWFINIKVDRDERPDIDSVYMKALVLLTGQGGWPASLFLTPDQKPYFGGTYFPPKDQAGRPGFPQILKQARDLYLNPEAGVKERSSRIIEQLQEPSPSEAADNKEDNLIPRAIEAITENYDEAFGGFGTGMKFPEPMIYSLLLRHWLKTESQSSFEIVDGSLTKMAEGGIYDQIGGGFHRYSTDRQWRVPHFEKMLYDNALLAKLFLDTYQVTHQEIYKTVPEEIFFFWYEKMTSPEGAFYSSMDADSEGVEGKYYYWELKETLELLGPENAKIFARAYGFKPSGPLGAKNIPHISDSLEKIAKEEGKPIFEVNHIVQKGKEALREARSKRALPGIDEKVITAWNGMMISALSSAYSILRKEKYLKAAERCAEFLWNNMWEDGVLHRVFQGKRAEVNGCLEDYAFLLDGMLSLYEASFELSWIKRSLDLAERMIGAFWDDEEGGFFMTGKFHEKLISRPKIPEDEAVPSANSVAAFALLRLGKLTGRKMIAEKGEGTVRAFRTEMEKNPAAYSGLLSALDFMQNPVTEIILAGSPKDPVFEEMVQAVHADYRPNKLLLWNGGEETKKWLPGVEGRSEVQGKPTAWLCQKGTCHPPVGSAEALVHLLESPPIIKRNLFDQEKHLADMLKKEQSNFLGAMSEIFKHSGLGKKQ